MNATLVILTVFVPGLIGLGVSLFAWRPWGERERADKQPYWAAGLGIVLGYLSLHLYLFGFPELNPSNDTHWLYAAALVALGVGVAEDWIDRHWMIWIGRILAFRLSLWLVIGYMFDAQWNAQMAVYWYDGLTAVAVVWLALYDFLAKRTKGLVVAASFIPIGLGAAGILFIGGTLKIAQLIAALTAASGSLMIPAFWNQNISFERTAGTVFVLIFGVLFASGYFGIYEPPPVEVVLIFAATPLAFLIFASSTVCSLSRWKQMGAMVVIMSLFIGVSIYTASNPSLVDKQMEESTESKDYGY